MRKVSNKDRRSVVIQVSITESESKKLEKMSREASKGGKKVSKSDIFRNAVFANA